MRWRAALAALVLTALAAGAGVGLLRSAGGTGREDRVREVAAGLRCPACQGESVADSRSPIAAAMRQVVADQLAQGRDRAEIRRWFVQRYGPEVLTEPPARGVTGLLWAVPALTLLGAGYAARRTLRPRRAPTRAAAARPAPAGHAARRAWWAGTAGLVSLVAAVAVAADQLDRPPEQPPADPVAVTVQLARDLETQDRYAAAAQLYREALQDRPDDTIQLRLAFALLRAGDSGAAAQSAREVLARTPDSPDGLLVLGLAQRGEHSAEAVGTLRRFLAVAPEHPAAPEITRLLSTGS
ncbi:cytochrome c-type biogenesis protein CcmH [Micromonospora viridifaciens]|uniref:Cytochrome c-type biogenesis protein n=1 Tax=Micromonospora viridifaciens TaxID=1881 RepID=A0A1C4XMJ2_MICVI|nr:cytochrome c-type biogenesis protein [Micromonospora viridifaciens]SCF09552.1 cytochrome c-type biogenesis protein CcmH [Micromonospora viridifaciens]